MNIGEKTYRLLYNPFQYIFIHLNELFLKFTAHIFVSKMGGGDNESYLGIMKCKLIKYRCSVFVLASDHGSLN